VDAVPPPFASDLATIGASYFRDVVHPDPKRARLRSMWMAT
jgi:hypothetical protein